MASAEQQLAVSKDYAVKLRSELLEIKRKIDGKVDRMADLIAGIAVPTRWVGTRLDVLGPDGEWIEGVDLLGPQSDPPLPLPVTFRISDAGDLEVRIDGEDEWSHIAEADRIAGIRPFASWQIGDVPYPARSFLVHDFKLWLSNAETSDEPSELSADWELLLDPTVDFTIVIDDETVAPDSVWSSEKIVAEIAAALAALVDSAPATLNTFNELATALGNDPNFAASIVTALGNRLRFDAAQTLDAGQKTQGRTNLGAASDSHGHANAVASTSDGFLSGADKARLDGMADSANNYVHPSGDGSRHVPSVAAGDVLKYLRAPAAAGEPPTWEEVVGGGAGDMLAATYDPGEVNGDAFAMDNMSEGADTKIMTEAERTKLGGIAENANNYSHPSGDGNLHVTATSTTNEGKALVAGATAGSFGWVALAISHITNLATQLAAKVETGRSIGAAGLATGGGDLSADRTITVTKASEAEAQAGSEDGKAMTPLRTKDAILNLFSLAGTLIASLSELTQGTASKLVSAARLIEALTPQTIADSAAMSMDMRAGWHAVVDQMAQDGTFTITNPQPGLSGWVLFQTDGSARTVQFQTGAVNMGEAWTGTRQKVFGASSKWTGHYTVQPGGGSPYLQWTFVKEGV